MATQRRAWGRLDGHEVGLYTIRNAAGASLDACDFGARLVRLYMPAPSGELADVVLGFDSVEAYREATTYFGATVGRFANRIRGGRFRLDGEDFQLDCNEGGNCLHGGRDGYDKRPWRAEFEPAGNRVKFSLRSADGDAGFPGELQVSSTYTLTEDHCLRVVMQASTDRPTLCNIAHHSYFNLAGHAAGDALDQELQILADFYTPTDAQRIITGEVRRVAGTAFDFREPRRLRDGIAQLGGARSGGYDHNWCLRGQPGRLRPVLTARDPASGRGFELATTEPGLQLYAGGYLDGAVIGKGGCAYPQFAGFALETQRFPDGPNLSHVPQSRLDPGRAYTHIMELRFFK